MRRGSGAMLTAALGLWLWLACGGRNLEGSPESTGLTGDGGAVGATVGGIVTSGVTSGFGGAVGTTVGTTVAPAVTSAGPVTTGVVSGTVGTVSTVGSTGTTVGTTTGTTMSGAGGTTMMELPPYVLLGAPLVSAPTASGFGLNVVLSRGNPRDLTAEVFDEETSTWHQLSNADEELPTEDSVQWQVDGLQPGRRYEYRIFAPGEDGGVPVVLYVGSAVTQRPAGDPFSFLLFTDTHIPPRELQPGETTLFDYPEQMLAMVAGGVTPGDADFIVNLGDMLDFHDFGFNQPPPDGSWTRLAYLNYRRLLGDLLGHTAHFPVIGNWDGENGDFTEEQITYSREQRLFYVPGPKPDTYPEGGNVYEDYYAFSWGDALFVVLNVMTYTPTSHLLSYGPGVADDWTLGDEQMAFLSTTLSQATAKWKFLLIHHAVGGAAGTPEDSAYGRGGGQAANVGEQAIVHELMQEYGAQVFFYGHDHVFTDMVVDDIHYTLPGSAGAQWKFSSDETGYTDYWLDSGHARVTVSATALTVEFVNFEGNVIYSYTLQ